MKQVVVVFGGSFNPPTNSHFSLAEQVYTTYEQVEKIIFVPVADQYPKKDLLPAAYRVQMLALVCQHNPHFEVSRLEVDAPQLMSTIDTLQAIQALYPQHEVWLTIGSDNLKLMHTWPCYMQIIKQFKCIVLERDKDKVGHILSSQQDLGQYQDRFIKATELVHSDCSATLVRHHLRAGKSVRYLVPDEVWDYITQKGLYTII